MKHVFRLCFKKNFFVFTVAVAVLLSCSFNALAATTTIVSEFLGRDNVNEGDGAFDFDIKAYVYRDNTRDTVEVSSMVQWIYNYGICNVNEVVFEGHDGDYDNHTYLFAYIDPVTTGNNARFEADWDGICEEQNNSHIYQKNGSEGFAFTRMASGYTYGPYGNWLSYWLWGDVDEVDPVHEFR